VRHATVRARTLARPTARVKGPQGPSGNDGVSVTNVYDDGSGRCIIQLSNGATFGPFTVANGPQGPQGNPGTDGTQGPQGDPSAPGEVTTADLNTAIEGTSANTNAVATLDTPLADPDMETLRQKINELLVALRRSGEAGRKRLPSRAASLRAYRAGCGIDSLFLFQCVSEFQHDDLFSPFKRISDPWACAYPTNCIRPTFLQV
jgi:hypothetical protein